MHQSLKKLAMFILAVAVLLTVKSQMAFADGDFVYSPELSISGPVAETVKWKASLEPKIKGDVQEAGEISLVGGINWKPINRLTLSPEFQYVTKGGTTESNERRIRLNLEAEDKSGILKIAFRNRFEYRMKEAKDEYWRYRARLKVKFPEIETATPFVYDEIFYEFGDTNELNGNEAGLGAGVPLGDNFGVDIDLRFCHSRKNDQWGTGTVELLTTFKYSF